jgi:hypothetical protein
MFGGERVGRFVKSQRFPVAQNLTEAEAGGAQGVGGLFGQGRRERDDDRLLAFVAQARLMSEGAPTERGPVVHPVLVVGAVAQRQQGAVEGVGLEIEQAGFVDQATGFDQSADAGAAFDALELCFLFGEPGFLLLMRTHALSARERTIRPPMTFPRSGCVNCRKVVGLRGPRHVVRSRREVRR